MVAPIGWTKTPIALQAPARAHGSPRSRTQGADLAWRGKGPVVGHVYPGFNEIYWDYIGIYWDYIGIYWDYIGIYWDYTGTYWDYTGI